jgi:hypothetical protein
MPNYQARYSSAYLSQEMMREFLAALPAIMLSIYGQQNLIVSYGWSCNLHGDLLFKPMQVSLDVFPYFIEDSISQRIFEVGGSDLLIESWDSQLRILMCHESDIHLDGADEQAMHQIIARFPELDFRSAEQWQSAS